MTGNINFSVYSTSNRVPGFYAEVNNSRANTGTINQRTLIIGQMTSAGNAVPNVAQILSGSGAAATAFGANSMLTLMAAQYRISDTFGEVWCLPLADAEITLATSAAQSAVGTTLNFAPGGILGAATPGEVVSGADIAAGTTVSAVDASAGTVTLSTATTAAVPSGAAISFGAAQAATGSITIAGAATSAGVLALYVAGIKITTAVNVSDTAATIATNLLAAINGNLNLPVVAAAGASGVVDLTAINKGLCGNDIDLRLNYLGTAGGETTPSGVSVTFGGTPSGSGTLLSGGSTNPTLTAALANLPTQPFDFIINPYTDTASLSALELFLNDTTGRWSWAQELFGGYFSAYRGTLGALTTFGVGNNDQHGSIMGVYDVPQTSWIWASEIAAQCASSLRANPAQPMQTLQMNVLAPPLQSQFDIGERNTLLYDGLSTFRVNQAGHVEIERMITTYQFNGSGAPDNSYLDVNTMYELMAVIRAYRTFLQSKFPRCILVANGSKINFGSNMVTAAIILASVNAYYQTLADQGLVQNPAQFAQQSQAQNAGNGLVKLMLPIQLANQLRQVAMLVEFTKP